MPDGDELVQRMSDVRGPAKWTETWVGLIGLLGVGIVCGVAMEKLYHLHMEGKKGSEETEDDVNKRRETLSTYRQLIGRTPLVKLKRLSEISGRNIYVKMESMNPGGTGKDRAVEAMLDDYEARGLLKPGMDIVEGTSGSTGISLAMQCRERGYPLHITMPDDQAEEKRALLRQFGATVHVVPSAAIANPNHYVKRAAKLANELGGICIGQFENTANWKVHYERTGPEIWNDTQGRIDGFVMSSGTGGTMAGVSRYLRGVKPSIRCILSDPFGSSLASHVIYGVCYTPQQAETRVRKHRYDSIVEGVGLDRLTANFEEASIDWAYQLPDSEMLNMAHFLLRAEGLFVGSSSALNVAVAYRAALERFPPGSTIVTVICDSGQRHLSRLYNEEYLKKYQLTPPADDCPLEDLLAKIEKPYKSPDVI